MRDHLQNTGYMQISTPLGVQSRESMDTEEGDSTYSAIFRQMFCVTAQDIARNMETRLQDLGSLFEDVLITGTLLSKNVFQNVQGKIVLANNLTSPHKDVEAGHFEQPVLFGRGQLLVLTRKVDKEESNRLQNIGYRFASTDQIGDQLARSMQISRDNLDGLIMRLEDYCDRKASIPKSGTHLAAFLLQPSPSMKGLDIITSAAHPDQLPMVKLMSGEPSVGQLRILSAFNGLTLNECLVRIGSGGALVTEDVIFLEKFRNRIQELIAAVPEPALRHATFSAQQLDIAHGISGQNEASQATVFAFCGIKEVYNQSPSSQKLQNVPLSFFKANLRSYPGCPDHAILAHQNHKEFSALFAPVSEHVGQGLKSGTKWTDVFRSTGRSMSDAAPIQADNCSEKGLVQVSQTSLDSASPVPTNNPFASIMVSHEVVISQDAEASTIEMQDMGVRSQAGIADSEQLTMADRLLSITTSFRDPHARMQNPPPRR